MKKRICFLTVRNIFAISCLPRYRDIIGENSFDIIYWDRYGIDESCGAENHYAMKYLITDNDTKLKKLYGYVKFILYARKILKNKKYDNVILLPTQTGIMLKSIMKKKYKGKYLIDIRDYTMENNNLYFMLMKDLIKNSGLAVITSPAYKKFLPTHDYLISHNVVNISDEWIQRYRSRKRNKSENIVISCIGGIRFHSQFKRVIKYFANDKRYVLSFIGDGSECLKDYCKKNNIDNVKLVGRFTQNLTLDYYMDTDIIMNLYGNNDPLLDYALSNKLYYAAILGIPILVCPNTYMEEVSVKYGFGFTFDLNDNFMLDELYKYYWSIKWETFYQSCDRYMQKVYSDDNNFRKTISSFLEK